jgi:hypothetical protein
MYTADLLRSSFLDFEILKLEEHDSHTSEGKGHLGMAAVSISWPANHAEIVPHHEQGGEYDGNKKL